MISKEEVQHIAKLARLQLAPQETEAMQKDMSAILDYFGLLKKAPKLKTATTKKSPHIETVTRKDKVAEKNMAQPGDLVNAAPAQKDGYIKVKAIL